MWVSHNVLECTFPARPTFPSQLSHSKAPARCKNCARPFEPWISPFGPQFFWAPLLLLWLVLRTKATSTNFESLVARSKGWITGPLFSQWVILTPQYTHPVSSLTTKRGLLIRGQHQHSHQLQWVVVLFREGSLKGCRTDASQKLLRAETKGRDLGEKVSGLWIGVWDKGLEPSTKRLVSFWVSLPTHKSVPVNRKINLIILKRTQLSSTGSCSLFVWCFRSHYKSSAPKTVLFAD